MEGSFGGRVTVFGGTGFIGRRLVACLVERGAAVRVVSRSPAADRLPRERCEWMAGDIQDAGVCEAAVAGGWAVVDLVGTTSARSERQFHALHREAPRRLAEAARRAGAERFVYASAMGVAPGAPAIADRSKAAGEAAVQSAFPAANIVRPALVYGPDDHFFARFGALVRSAPAIPLIGGGRTRFQPMHVDDLAEAVARMLADPGTAGRTFELGADEVFSFRDLIEALCRALGRQPWLVPVPFALAAAAAYALERLPGAPLTVDQVRLLQTDKVRSGGADGPDALGLAPRPLAGFLLALGAARAGVG